MGLRLIGAHVQEAGSGRPQSLVADALTTHETLRPCPRHTGSKTDEAVHADSVLGRLPTNCISVGLAYSDYLSFYAPRASPILQSDERLCSPTGYCYSGCAASASLFRRLRGRISVQTSLI